MARPRKSRSGQPHRSRTTAPRGSKRRKSTASSTRTPKGRGGKGKRPTKRKSRSKRKYLGSGLHRWNLAHGRGGKGKRPTKRKSRSEGVRSARSSPGRGNKQPTKSKSRVKRKYLGSGLHRWNLAHGRGSVSKRLSATEKAVARHARKHPTHTAAAPSQTAAAATHGFSPAYRERLMAARAAREDAEMSRFA